MNIALMKKQKKQARFLEKKAREESALPITSAAKKIHRKEKDRYQNNVSAYELENDLERLSEINEIPEKIAYKKAALIPKYTKIVQSYCDSGETYANEIMVYLIIWLIDVEMIEEAIVFADIAIEQGQDMPERFRRERFKRDLPTFVSEEICTWAERQHKAELSAAPYLNNVAERLIHTTWSVRQKIVLNKIYKLMALYAEKDSDWPQAVYWFEQCVKCNPEGHGVKTKLATAKKFIEAS